MLRQSLGQHDRAIKHYGEYARRYKDRSDAKSVAFQAAVVREDQKDWRGAAASFAAYSKSYPGDARTVEAHAREADAHLKAGNDGARQGRRREGAVGVRRRQARSKANDSAEDASYCGGAGALHPGRAGLPRLRDASRSPASRASSRRCSRRRPSASKRRRRIYLDVVTYKSPEWATAGLLRIGQGYEAYAKAMRNAPVPKDLNADEKQMYRDELEKVVVVIEDKALDAYKSGYAKALTIGVYNKHTQTIRQALSRLAENEYPKEAEQRLSTRPGEPRIALDRIEEVRRDQ